MSTVLVPIMKNKAAGVKQYKKEFKIIFNNSDFT